MRRNIFVFLLLLVRRIPSRIRYQRNTYLYLRYYLSISIRCMVYGTAFLLTSLTQRYSSFQAFYQICIKRLVKKVLFENELPILQRTKCLSVSQFTFRRKAFRRYVFCLVFWLVFSLNENNPCQETFAFVRYFFPFRYS